MKTAEEEFFIESIKSEAELKGFADGHSFSKKKFYEGVFTGLGVASLAVVLAACLLKTLTN